MRSMLTILFLADDMDGRNPKNRNSGYASGKRVDAME